MKRIAMGIVLAGLCFSALADPCTDNFTADGNFLTGQTYKSWVLLPNVRPQDAFARVYSYTIANGFSVTSSSKETGAIFAVQAGSTGVTKMPPLSISLQPDPSGAKLAIVYTTRLGQISPLDAIKRHFCGTFAAAANASNGGVATSTVLGAQETSTRSSITVPPGLPQPSSSDGGTVKGEYAKNGLPCVAEICIGDGMAELLAVKWDRAKPSESYRTEKTPKFTSEFKLDRTYVEKNLSYTYRPDYLPAANYLLNKQFDSDALPLLEHVAAACEPHTLKGTFTSAGGNPTAVEISLLPKLTDTSKAVWTVVRITRTYPTAVTLEQQAEVGNIVRARYKDFDSVHSSMRKVEPGVESGNFDGGGTGFSLWLSLDVSRGAYRMKQHPACGGGVKVKVD